MQLSRVPRRIGVIIFSWLFLWLFLQHPLLAAVWHVAGYGDDARGGGSWAEALASPQVALTRASPGDAVWIAGGVYEATDSVLLQADAEWEWSFRLRDGVDIYGGFAGHESSPEERALAAARDGIPPCAWDFAAATILTIPDHALGSVLKAEEPSFTRRTVIDGVVLSGGMAFSSGLSGLGGGALLPGKVVLRRSIIVGCMARFGGGVLLRGDSLLQQCLVCDNELLSEGWGAAGGGVYVMDDTARISNCLIRGNGIADRGVQEGGGIYLLGAGTVHHCTIVGNYAQDAGSGICAPFAAAHLLNLVVWGNNGNERQLFAPAAEPSHCAVAGAYANGETVIPLAAGNCGVNGPELNDNENEHYYICFRDLQRNDYRLGAGSYAINRGCSLLLEDFDAGGQPRLSKKLTDLGAMESPYPGQLCVDFQVETPCIYGWESQVTPRLGVCSPVAVEAVFQAPSGLVSWRRDAESRHYAQWLQSGPVALELNLTLLGEEADAWESASCCRHLLVQQQTLFIAAQDLDYSYGASMPVLGWELQAGRLAAGDRIVGSLSCTLGAMLERSYPILQGSLAIDDGQGGANYHIVFFPGQLHYHKAEASLRLAADSCVYNGKATAPALLQDPPGLNIELLYSGCEGTNYAESGLAPRNVGSYLLTATVKDEHYCGTLQQRFQITPAPLTVHADNLQRPFGAANPPLTMSFSGFCGGDGLVDLQQQPSLTTSAGPSSPVCAGGYPILLSGGSARNYVYVYRPGVLTITPAALVASELASEAIVYGSQLSKSALSGRVCSVSNGELVPGNFSWNNSSEQLSAGTHMQSWSFQANDSNNYQTLSGVSSVRVKCRAITVTAQAQSKIYGEADPPLVYDISSGSLVGKDSFTGALARQAGENVGVYAVEQGSLALPANYTLSYMQANLHITARPVTVKAQDCGKAFGTADPVLPYVVSSTLGLLAGDSFHGALSRAPGEEVGVYAINQGNLGLSANYQLSFSGANFAISAAALHLSAPLTIGAMSYGQPLRRASIVGEVSHVATGEKVPGTFSWVEENSTPPAGSGDYQWFFVPDGVDGYAPLYGYATLDVAAASLEVRLQNPAPSRSYGMANPAFALTYSGFVLGDGLSVLTQLPTAHCAADQASAVGAYPIVISGAKAANYVFSYEPGLLTVTPALPNAQELTSATGAVYGMPLADIALCGVFAHPAQSEPIAGVLSWELPGNTVLSAGEHWLRWVFMPESSNYSELRGEQPLTILKAPLQVCAEDQSRWYGDENPPLTLSYKGLVNGDVLTTPGLFRSAPQAQCAATCASLAGTYPITVAGGIADNYRFIYTIGSMTVKTIVPVVQSFEAPVFYYGENVASRAPVAELRHPGTGAIMEGYFTLCGEAACLPVGVWPRSWRFVSALPGSVSEIEVAADLRIEPRQLRIQPMPASKVYGDADPSLDWAFAAGSMSLYGLDRVEGELSRLPGEQLGDYSITLGTLSAGSNYCLELLPGRLSICQREVTLQCLSATKVYGDPDPPFQYHVLAGSLLAGDLPVGQLGRAAGEGVGSYAINQGSLKLPDYYRVVLQSAQLAISPRPLTLAAHSVTKVYGDPDPAFTWSISSGTLLPGDDLEVALQRQTGENVGAYTISAKKLDGRPNYSLSFVEATLSIVRCHIGVIAHDQRKLLGGADPVLTYELAPGSVLPSGACFSGSLSWSGSTAIGRHIILIGTLSLGDNYIIDYTPGYLTLVYPFPILAETVEAAPITYGDTLAMAQLSGRFLHPLTLETLPGTLVWDNPNRTYLAGGYSSRYFFFPDPASGISQSYQGTATVVVMRRRLKIVADWITKAYGDALPVLTWHISEGALYFNDNLSGRLACSYQDVLGQYPITQGSLSAPTSYELEYVAGVLEVTPRILHLQAYDNSKIAGAADPALSYFLASGSYYSTARPTGNPIRDAGEAPGNYAIRQGTLTAPANHSIVFTNGVFTIHPATRGSGECPLAALALAQGEAEPGCYGEELGEAAVLFGEEGLASCAVVSADFADGLAAEMDSLPADVLCCSTIEEAIAGVSASALIRVMPGLYQAPGDGCWLLDKALTLSGMSDYGAEEVILHGSVIIAGSNACAVQVAGLSILSQRDLPAVVLGDGVSQVALTDNTLIGGACALSLQWPRHIYLMRNQLGASGVALHGDIEEKNVVAFDNVFMDGSSPAE
jgi:hypothetical protein